MPPNGTGKQDALTSLSALLRTALELTTQLRQDSHLPRLLSVFARLPTGDRRSLIEKLESEVHARQRSMETGDGLVGAPNPLASLYVRIYENDKRPPDVTRDRMLRSTIQTSAFLLALPDAVRGEVERALLATMATLDPADAAALARHHRDLLALAAWCQDVEVHAGAGVAS
jgi:hypothetical protein